MTPPGEACKRADRQDRRADEQTGRQSDSQTDIQTVGAGSSRAELNWAGLDGKGRQLRFLHWSCKQNDCPYVPLPVLLCVHRCALEWLSCSRTPSQPGSRPQLTHSATHSRAAEYLLLAPSPGTFACRQIEQDIELSADPATQQPLTPWRPRQHAGHLAGHQGEPQDRLPPTSTSARSLACAADVSALVDYIVDVDVDEAWFGLSSLLHYT